MSPEEVTALARVVKDTASKTARDALEPGPYDVDFLVHVKGEITVGEDGERAPTASIPVKEVLALFIQRSGCTREAAKALLRECLTEALSKNGSGVGAFTEEIDDVFKHAVEEVTRALPKTKVRGAVNTRLSYTLVSLGEEEVRLAAK